MNTHLTAAENFAAQIGLIPGYVEPEPLSYRTALRLSALLRRLQPERYDPLPEAGQETLHTAVPHRAQSPESDGADCTAELTPGRDRNCSEGSAW